MLLASKHFTIERLSKDEFDLRVRFKCLHCGFISVCDLYKLSLERCLQDHLDACSHKPVEEALNASRENAFRQPERRGRLARSTR